MYVSSAPPHASPLPALESEILPSSSVFFFRSHGPCASTVTHPHNNIKLGRSSQIYQSNIVRYSQTAAVMECSEWAKDNTNSSSTCCLSTHTHSHADTHSLYQSQGYCQCMCQHYQSYFSLGQFSSSPIRAKVEVCMRQCRRFDVHMFACDP